MSVRETWFAEATGRTADIEPASSSNVVLPCEVAATSWEVTPAASEAFRW